MKAKDVNELPLFRHLEARSLGYASIILNKEKFAHILEGYIASDDLASLKSKILTLKSMIRSYKYDREGILNIDSNGDTVSLRRDVLISELDQILEARTLQRAKYYLRRLKAGVERVKTNKVNDINLLRWKEYDEIITDSLWIFDRRDTSGAHLAWYWGNFIPQIPHQMILRFSEKEGALL